MPNHLRRSDAQPQQEWLEDNSGPYCLEISFSDSHGYRVAEFTNMDQRSTRGERDCIVIEGLSHERLMEVRNAIAKAVSKVREEIKIRRLNDIESAMESAMKKIRQRLSEVNLDGRSVNLAQEVDLLSEKIVNFPDIAREKERFAIFDALSKFDYLKRAA